MAASILFLDMREPFLPLIAAAAENGLVPILDGPLTQRAREQGIPCLDLETFTPSDIQERTNREISRIAWQLEQALQQPDALKVFSSPLGNFLPRTGQPFFQRLLEMLVLEINAAEIFTNLVEQQEVALVVLRTEKGPGERTIISLAARYGIPTLQVAHSIYQRVDIAAAGEYQRGLDADYIAVFGARAARFLREMGVEERRIFVTGSPYADTLGDPASLLSRQEACRQLGLDPSVPVLLFCASFANSDTPFYPTNFQCVHDIHGAVVQAVAQCRKPVQFLVRPHPYEIERSMLSPADERSLLQAYQDYLGRQGVTQYHISRGDKIPAIRAADLVVVGDMSSIIPEIMVLERPMVALPWRLEAATGVPYAYTAQDGIAVIEDLGQLPELVQTLLDDPGRRQEMVRRQKDALPDLNCGHDGHALLRLTRLVLALAWENLHRQPSVSNAVEAKPFSPRKNNR
jgi:hypothetical protein